MRSVPVHPAGPQTSPHPIWALPPGVPPADPTRSPQHADLSPQDTARMEGGFAAFTGPELPGWTGCCQGCPGSVGRDRRAPPLPRVHPPGGQRGVPVRVRRCPGPRACGPAATAGTRGRRAERCRGTARRVWPRCSAGHSEAAGRGAAGIGAASPPNAAPCLSFPFHRAQEIPPRGQREIPEVPPQRTQLREPPAASPRTAARPVAELRGERSDPTPGSLRARSGRTWNSAESRGVYSRLQRARTKAARRCVTSARAPRAR